MRASGCKLPLRIAILALTGIATALIGAPAPAQDLDRGKSRAELFKATCAGCHRSPARARQGPVQLDAVVLPAAALHEQQLVGADVDGLPAVSRCRSPQRARCRRQIAHAGRKHIDVTAEHVGAISASAGRNTGALAAGREDPRSEVAEGIGTE